MFKIVADSVEPVIIVLTDQLGLVTDASDLLPTFQVFDDEGTAVQDSTDCLTYGNLNVGCVIDTTDLESQRLNLYLYLEGVEGIAIKGPFFVFVERIGTT